MLSLFRSKAPQAVPALYAKIVAASRQPAFYTRMHVPDTLDGRYALLALHAFLVMRRLRGEADALAQQLFDHMFAQIDLNLREMGVGDLGVYRRARAMAESLYGSMAAYEEGLRLGGEKLHQALCNNLYGTLPQEPTPLETAEIIAYMEANVSLLAAIPVPKIAQGEVEFSHVDP